MGTGALLGLAAAGLGVLTLVVARTVVTPPRRKREDATIVAVDLPGRTITLGRTGDAILPGDYGLWFSGDRGYARIGEILETSADSVTRRLIEVRFGDLAAATRGRFSGWFYLSPADLGSPFEEVGIETELGEAPAWLVPSSVPTDRWVIQVHGRAVRRQETLRAIPVFRDAGYTSLIISYRNDGDAPYSPDRRYGLGDTEWRDVDAALRFAVDHGARDVVLMGWSMGGATALQAVTRSARASVVRGIVLDSPVVDWVTALRYQGELMGLPSPIRSGALEIIGARWGRRLTGQLAPIDLSRLDFVRRASELTVPILLMHSDDDGYIPPTASRALAEARPDIVTYEAFTGASHTKLWNYDRDRWNGVISGWLARLDAPDQVG